MAAIPWEEIQRVAGTAPPEIRELARELSDDTMESAWFEPFEPDDEWLLAALTRAYELGARAR